VVVQLTLPLPRWWRCELAQLSDWLEKRWETGYWQSGGLPAGLCAACNRRAAWIVVGGRDWFEDLEPDGTFLESHPVHLCGSCRLGDRPVGNPTELQAALAEARTESVAWRWSWRPRDDP
jgi:choline dehydrogenase-like flavoprotein